MTSAEQFRPKTVDIPGWSVVRVEEADPELNWFLHESVGVEFSWGGRQDWGRKQWTDYIDRPDFETWIAYLGGRPAGYFELVRQDDGTVRIACFGLRQEFFGRGLGADLLTRAIQRAWELTTTRVWLRTCSHDHPHALDNYLARGFVKFGEVSGPPNPSRESELFGGR